LISLKNPIQNVLEYLEGK